MSVTAPAIAFSDDQAQAHDRIAEALRGIGVDLDNETLTPAAEGPARVMAVVARRVRERRCCWPNWCAC